MFFNLLIKFNFTVENYLKNYDIFLFFYKFLKKIQKPLSIDFKQK